MALIKNDLLTFISVLDHGSPSLGFLVFFLQDPFCVVWCYLVLSVRKNLDSKARIFMSSSDYYRMFTILIPYTGLFKTP